MRESTLRDRRRRLGRAGVSLISLLLVAGGVDGADAGEGSSCSSAGGTLAVTAGQGSHLKITAASPAGSVVPGQIEVREFDSPPFACSGTTPTLTSIDSLDFSGPGSAPAAVEVEPLAPGLTDEGNGTSEIEMDFRFGRSDRDSLFLVISGRREGADPPSDLVRVGRRGSEDWINLNAEAEGASEDLDLQMSGLGRGRLRPRPRPELGIATGRGDDAVLGTGGPGFTGPTRIGILVNANKGDDRVVTAAGNDFIDGGLGNDVVKGGKGRDRLVGEDGNDRLNGGPGRDAFEGGPGRDRIGARDGIRDLVDCGPGKGDVAKVDRSDRVLGGCERVRRR